MLIPCLESPPSAPSRALTLGHSGVGVQAVVQGTPGAWPAQPWPALCLWALHGSTSPLICPSFFLLENTICNILKIFLNRGNIGLKQHVSFMCIYSVYIVFRALDTLPHAHHRSHTVDPLYPLCTPVPLPPTNHCSVLCIYLFVWVWFALSFILGFLLVGFHMNEILQPSSLSV